eukprot:CAMPEP_0206601550 /NCGR_PEP_ID=MMETSP0325_2-20121206/46707_1 /ASSEMBLY_ACC=CAM_ASM_000347 /TAXON_ID=2866 /ORGANISM="Crypthecodinium cohnii, Strain Seligo" /LENGTH=43 /DNA_ID= /DNA_START= /DNA_END= /DNA_ORIENTATION=
MKRCQTDTAVHAKRPAHLCKRLGSGGLEMRGRRKTVQRMQQHV